MRSKLQSILANLILAVIRGWWQNTSEIVGLGDTVSVADCNIVYVFYVLNVERSSDVERQEDILSHKDIKAHASQRLDESSSETEISIAVAKVGSRLMLSPDIC